MGSTHSRILWLVWYQSKNLIETVIQSARAKPDLQGLCYQNDVESQHAVEKCIQNHKKEDILVVIKSLERLSDWQDTEEVNALYGAGSYTVNEPYKKFLVQSSEWHSWSDSRRQDHVKKFQQYDLCMTDRFSKPENSGRKLSYQKSHRSLEPDVVNDRCRETETRTALESEAFTTSIQAEKTMWFPDPR